VSDRTCGVAGCARDRYCKGFCQTHYGRWRKTGDPGPAEILPFAAPRGRQYCSVTNCNRPYLARDYCSMHWQRWKKTGDPGPAEAVRQQQARCSVDACDRAHYGQGYCSPHLRRWLRNGDPGPAEIQSMPSICAVDGCEDGHSARGYCASHYARWNRKGDAGTAFTVRRRNPRLRDDEGRKQCRVCDKWRSLTDFYQVSASPDGKSPSCKECHHARLVAQYAATLASQGGRCAICDAPSGKRRFHIDHDHSHCSANQGCDECVRGLLCSPCNTGLGMFSDNADRLRSAIAYMETRALVAE
jgi:hypothetical protein